MTEEEKRERRLRTRFRWADNILTQEGFERWGDSHVHGCSWYYILESTDPAEREHYVRIRVSDHYAHRFQSGTVDFTVEVDPDLRRSEVERRTRQAIHQRETFLASADFKVFCEDEEIDWTASVKPRGRPRKQARGEVSPPTSPKNKPRNPSADR
jgi:hypothetical protein